MNKDLRYDLFLFFVIGFVALAFQVAITRVFAFIIFQEIIFLAIAFAIFGISIGALIYKRVKVNNNLLIYFSLSILISLLLIIITDLNAYSIYVWLIYGLLSAAPFIVMGIYSAHFYQTYPKQVGKLYASDLAGAALGALTSIYFINLLNPIYFITAIAIIPTIISIVQTKKFYLILIPILFLLIFSSSFFETQILERDVPGRPLFIEKGSETIEETRWNSISRLDLIGNQRENEKSLYIDASVPAKMISKNFSKEKIRNSLGYLPFTYGNNQKVLSLGVGAGFDIAIANEAGVQTIDAVEINKQLIDIVNDHKDYTGDILNKPNVNIIINDGRNYISNTDKKYDLILLYLAQGNNAEGLGNTPTQNFLFTKEAYSQYYDHLTEEGKIAVITDKSFKYHKHLLTWIEMTKQKGLTQSEALNRTIVAFEPYQSHAIISIFHKNPITSNYSEKIIEHANGTNLTLLFIPNQIEIDTAPTLLFHNNITPQRIITEYGQNINVEPLTDNKPFNSTLYKGIYPSYFHFALLSILILGIMYFTRGNLRWNSYFVLLGIGFIIVEILLIRKLMLYLGHPALSLTVVIFALLLGSAIGSFYHKKIKYSAPLVAILLPIYFYFIGNLLSHNSLTLRITIALLTIIILGSLMGTLFPQGLSRVEKKNWYLALNGVAILFGSVLTLILASTFGITFTIYIAALCYLGVFLFKLS